ncbi:hypothetical protein [Azospirillum sp.]|uniref:hypothetical protein n=1 Tax=Azospirillum sp. TaxID=34012 RepID=UPI003D72D06E
MTAPLLIDVGAVPDCTCTDHLDGLYKALAENPSADDKTIWAPHPNPYLTAHVEESTARLQAILERIQDTLARLLTGEPIGELSKADVPWLRWSEADFQHARMRLEAKRPEDYELSDWMLLVDYLIQRYLPEGVIQSEAEYLTVRASMLGKVQANMAARKPSTATIGAVAFLIPTSFAHVPPHVLNPVELEVLKFARARAAENISDVTEGARHRMKTLIREHLQAQILGQKEGTAAALRQRIFDEFGQLNRDFRRIAVTEAGECCNSGFIAAQKPGKKVRRVEAYQGACEFCRSINGKVFTVVSPAKPDKDGEAEIWLGKTNIGRSAAPRKKVGAELVEREPHERWWPAAGVQHPHCRGAWTPVVEKPPEVSQEFADWLDGLIATAQRS